MDRNCYQPAFLRRLMADCRLLRQPDLAHPVPTSVRQPLLCLRHHRARSHVLSQQRIQIHRCPQFHYPDSRRCGSGYGSPLRSRTLRTDYHPDHLQHTDICHFLPALSATIALHMGIDSTPQDLFIFGLSIPVQRHQLFQS